MNTGSTLREMAEWLGLSVRGNEEMTVTHGRGPSARSCVVRPAQLGDLDRADVAGFVRGLHAVLNEPARSKAAEWDFAEAARVVMPTLERPSWRLGVVAAGGAAPFAVPFGGDLTMHFVLELDVGYHALSAAQVTRWGATADRVERAAASMLFHRTRDAAPEPFGETAGVETIRIGDGFDAVRANVLDACDYAMCRAGIYFALPSPDRLLLTRVRGEEGLTALRAATSAAFASARLPLSSQIFAWEAGRRIAAPVG